MLRLIGRSDTARAAMRGAAPAHPRTGASLLANIRFAQALGWTSRRLERGPAAPRLRLVGPATAEPSHAGRGRAPGR